ncbi:coil containing protein [Vibrio phage 1.122.B._10N.286.46.F8]|nr:coil containing protein [Vibrio phage 1.122.A._10N.286.46.F8]AUR89425.1 coil containing protein [Vibrio phage 1.122.B._10N.286.46.F8]
MSTEWNGEGLPPVDVKCEWIGGGVAHGDWGVVIVRAYSGGYAWIEKLHDNSMHTVRGPAFFRKLETPQQREERERLEAAYHLYSIAMIANEDEPKSFDHFSKHNYKSGWIAVVIETAYQKA